MIAEVKINKHTCATHGCGITFWLEEGYEARRREDKEGFYCPNGHSLAYEGKTADQRIADIIKQKNEEINRIKAECAKKKRGRPAKNK